MEFWILLIALEFFFAGFMVWIAWPSIFGAPWIPTPKNKARSMLELAEVSHQDIVYDIGSGDGRIIIMAASEFGAKSFGIEMDPLRVLWSRLAIRRSGLSKKVEVLRENFFNSNIEDATVVTVYQGVGVNKKLREKFSRELKPGTRVVSYRFRFQGWSPVKTNEETSSYLYVI
ncbi:MAG: SAM-dependent methyltransferase [Candidatus Thorarchaeota archaeon]|jgi:cyclopropane fatty-acyl-phospholipid synthase-like methyltransferase